ncbi:MAG: TraR/DksA family transcriptional regulator [Bradymonadaceae bacterium]
MSEDFSPHFLEGIQEELERQRADIINKSHVTRAEMRERDREPRDSIDDSTDEQGTSTQLKLKDRERNLLAKINEALARIDSDDYGYCETCGDFIGEARLKARPVTTMCIDCKEDQEELERRKDAVNPGLFRDID